MAVFLTRYRDRSGRLWPGPEIHASSWDAARIELANMWVTLTLDDVLVERIDAETRESTVYPPPEDDQ